MRTVHIKNKVLLSCTLLLVGLIASYIPFTHILGSNTSFTLFDFIAPTFGAYLGIVGGVSTVFFVQLIRVIFHGFPIPSGEFIRLFPILFGVWYFSKKQKVNVVVPALCMIVFNLHPIGRSAWQYSLFWLIPIITYFFRKNIFLRSLGATFTTHAVGGAIWVWVFGLSRETWIALIPQVMVERLLMTVGITLSYIGISRIIAYICLRTKPRIVYFSS